MSLSPWYRLATFKAARAVAHTLPRGLCQALAGAIGRCSHAANSEAREALRANLEVVTGLAGSNIGPLCRRNFSNFLKMLADYFYTAGAGAGKIQGLCSEWRGFGNLVAARERGKGTIVITAHLGNWELGGLLLATEGFPLTVISLEEPAPELTRWREEQRRRLGIKTITVGTDKFAFVEMINALRRNEFLAMLIDRPYAQSGVPVRFFGHETQFSSAPALLWKHTGATVLPAFVLQSERHRYLSFADAPVPMEGGEAVSTQRIATAFEGIIREHPEQWYNYVRIWK